MGAGRRCGDPGFLGVKDHAGLGDGVPRGRVMPGFPDDPEFGEVLKKLWRGQFDRDDKNISIAVW